MNERQARRQLRWVRFRLNHPNLATLLDILAFPITLPRRWWLRVRRARENAILRALAGGPLRGREIGQSTGVRRGALYVHLNRMEAEGLVSSRDEPQPEDQRRLPGRVYRLSDWVKVPDTANPRPL